MNITFINPLSNAWNRMVNDLFRQFDIVKWYYYQQGLKHNKH